MCVNIQIIDDNICEDDENFLLSLTAVDDCIDIFIPGGTVTIIDDDGNVLRILHIPVITYLSLFCPYSYSHDSVKVLIFIFYDPLCVVLSFDCPQWLLLAQTQELSTTM